MQQQMVTKFVSRRVFQQGVFNLDLCFGLFQEASVLSLLKDCNPRKTISIVHLNLAACKLPKPTLCVLHCLNRNDVVAALCSALFAGEGSCMRI